MSHQRPRDAGQKSSGASQRKLLPTSTETSGSRRQDSSDSLRPDVGEATNSHHPATGPTTVPATVSRPSPPPSPPPREFQENSMLDREVSTRLDPEVARLLPGQRRSGSSKLLDGVQHAEDQPQALCVGLVEALAQQRAQFLRGQALPVVEQAGDVRAQTLGDAAERDQGRVASSELDRAEVRRVNARALAELLQREIGCVAQGTDACSHVGKQRSVVHVRHGALATFAKP